MQQEINILLQMEFRSKTEIACCRTGFYKRFKVGEEPFYFGLCFIFSHERNGLLIIKQLENAENNFPWKPKAMSRGN